MNSNQTAARRLQPVIVGGDIGVYALVRSFHETYGVRSIVLAEAETGAVGQSSIIDLRIITVGQHPERLIDALVACAREQQEASGADQVDLVLLTNSDWYARLLVGARDELENAGYKLPFPSLQTFEEVSDKQQFARIAGEVGMRVPTTQTIDFSPADDAGWQPEAVTLRYPLVCKPAVSSYWQTMSFDGKKKIYFVETAEQLERLWQTLRTGGFRGEFLVQELVPGDDTTQRSVTAYVDGEGRVTMLSGARVLLEDHTPAGMGIPAAMISDRDDELLDQARRFLEHVDYHGFANFDAKIDPRDGSAVFFEVNPRIGRNNYYVSAGGTSPAAAVVRDVIAGESPQSPDVVSQRVLYTTVPTGLLLKYLTGAQSEEVRRLLRTKQVVEPLKYPRVERSLRRGLYLMLASANQRRKYRKYYPETTETGF
ncbi:hypothetical protein [Pseudoclavibacter sp. CFCC 13611]|uniref:carboxylate--amine ligase n=1 Tax=Pseudoclavibacter sp. CFCC 13611 TaxID=2615178 RepID=UPI0013015A63|nr:hypothetical protein [Pseudoclavibacter sp. CFCC 13611]KAB1663971.1 hypothetical protein F8O08_00635 [Pseudoclavibacter sp. CFCC 13611]